MQFGTGVSLFDLVMPFESQKPRQSRPRARDVRRWIPYAAASWAVAFAIVSFYWASGGTIGVGTLATSIQQLGRERDRSFVVEVWVTGVLKLLAAALALALTHSWSMRVLDRTVRIAVWVCGALLLLYGTANLAQDILIELHVVGVPLSMGASAVRWYLFLWEPWWILGGILFLGAAWSTRPTTGAG